MKRTTVGIFLNLALLLLCVSNACADQPLDEHKQRDLVATAKASGEFTVLIRLAEDADMLKELHEIGPFTVLAPTDDAFANLPPAVFRTLTSDRKQLKMFLLHHVVAAAISVEDATKNGTLKTALGTELDFAKRDGAVYINGMKTSVHSLHCTNGMLHSINRVLLPPGLIVPGNKNR